MVEKRNKNAKRVILLSLLGLFFGCSCVNKLRIGGEKQFLLSNENAQIKITANTDMRFFYILTVKSMKGNIKVHPQELKLTSIPIADTIRISGIYYEKERMSQSFTLSRGETFELKFSVFPKTPNSFIINEVHILPGDFITYKGTPLITDTIKVNVRGNGKTAQNFTYNKMN